MTDLPAGWETYDPEHHERTADPDYAEARADTDARGERRRREYGTALAAIRRARSLTQTAVAGQLGVAQGEVSRIEHQADLLLSTLARYVEAVGGELGLFVRFPGHDPVELDPDLAGLLGTAHPLDDRVRTLDQKEQAFRDINAA